MGAFEDRLQEGYRQAANTPAKTSQPTTPTEALVQAARAWSRNPHAGPEWRRLMQAVDEYEHAEAWRKQRCGPDDVTVTVDGLTSALDHLGPVRERVMDPDSDMSNAEFAAAIRAALSANHTPSASTGRPCTFRPAWVPKPCGKPESDPTHAGQSDRKMPGQHVYRNKGR